MGWDLLIPPHPPPTTPGGSAGRPPGTAAAPPPSARGPGPTPALGKGGPNGRKGTCVPVLVSFLETSVGYSRLNLGLGWNHGGKLYVTEDTENPGDHTVRCSKPPPRKPTGNLRATATSKRRRTTFLHAGGAPVVFSGNIFNPRCIFCRYLHLTAKTRHALKKIRLTPMDIRSRPKRQRKKKRNAVPLECHWGPKGGAGEPPMRSPTGSRW